MEDIFEQISSTLDLDDPRQKLLSIAKGIVDRIPDAAGKRYAISRILNETPEFSNYEQFPGVNTDAWSHKYQEDYKPPFIENKEKSEDEKSFWNWESDRHWTKRNLDELKRKAKDYGYSVKDGKWVDEEGNYKIDEGFKAFIDNVSKNQTDIDTNKELSKYGYGIYGRLFTPRRFEAQLRREDPTWKDTGLDILENGMYMANPFGRGAKALTMSRPGIAFGIEALANPLFIEMADAAAYGDESNSDRKNFNGVDVLFGTGVNLGMNRIAPQIFKSLQKKKIQGKLTPQEKVQYEYIESKMKDNDEYLKMLSNENRSNFVKSLTPEERIGEQLTATERSLKLQQELDLLNKKIQENPSKAEMLREEFKNKWLKPSDYISNKLGDVLSEDPKMQKRLVRTGAKTMGIGPLFGLLENVIEDKETNEEQKKLDWLLGDWRK